VKYQQPQQPQPGGRLEFYPTWNGASLTPLQCEAKIRSAAAVAPASPAPRHGPGCTALLPCLAVATWPTEVPANPYHSVILILWFWFCDSDSVSNPKPPHSPGFVSPVWTHLGASGRKSRRRGRRVRQRRLRRQHPPPRLPSDAAGARSLCCCSGQEITIFLSPFGRHFAKFKDKKAKPSQKGKALLLAPPRTRLALGWKTPARRPELCRHPGLQGCRADPKQTQSLENSVS